MWDKLGYYMAYSSHQNDLQYSSHPAEETIQWIVKY